MKQFIQHRWFITIIIIIIIVIFVCMLCCFSYGPLGCLLSTLINKTLILILIIIIITIMHRASGRVVPVF
jgi:hypothetical protein